MNRLEEIKAAIDYVEANLTGKLEIEEIAAKAYLSKASFQKTFALLCGFTVGEYIRNRRLSEAGNDLLATSAKVIDIALKYGYDSPEGFTKAFTRFHGATPNAVRRQGRPVKSYAPLRLELFVKGGYVMDYRLQKQKAFKAKVKADGDNATVWILKDGKLSDFDLFCLEASLRKEYPGYALRRVETGDAGDLSGYGSVSFPEVLWAIFVCSGTSRDDAREKTVRKIHAEWFPQTGYEPYFDHPSVIHVYSGGDSEDYGEIMIPVREKKNRKRED